jgi:hypothetical protein
MKKSIVLFASAVLISAGLAKADVINLPVVNHSFQDPVLAVDETSLGAPGWTQSGVTQFQVKNPGFLAPDGTTQRLQFDVAGASGAAEGYASQNIDISSYASDIDGGGVTSDFAYDFRSNDGTRDSSNFAIDFLNASNVSIGGMTTAWSYATGWNLGSISNFAVPVGARSLTITLGARRDSLAATDIYFDNIRASLTGVTIPEPATFGIVLSALAAAVIRRRRFG